MERMNLLHYGVNKFLKEVVNNAKDCYPLLKTFEYTIDSREDQNYDLSRLESKLSKIMYWNLKNDCRYLSLDITLISLMLKQIRL